MTTEDSLASLTPEQRKAIRKILDDLSIKLKAIREDEQKRLRIVVDELRAANIPEEEIRKRLYPLAEQLGLPMNSRFFIEVLDR